jgi:hypothetical protein
MPEFLLFDYQERHALQNVPDFSRQASQGRQWEWRAVQNLSLTSECSRQMSEICISSTCFESAP